MARFYPSDYQTKLPMDRWIVKDQGENEDQVPMDVLFVGGGPAGLAGAIRLAQQVAKAKTLGDFPDIEIGVLEKAESLGGHSLSGAVINPRSLQELFPDMALSDFPFKGPVEGDEVHLLTQNGNFRLPTPPTMHNTGNFRASICEVVRWMGEQAEELGVNLLTSFPAESLIVDGNRVTGVKTTPAGLNRDGSEGSQYMPGTEVKAQVTVLTDGPRGHLTQAYLEWQSIKSKAAQIYALGVKEMWKVKTVPKNIIHTMGWPLPTDAFGGSFLYPMGDDLVSLGLVVGLDYRQDKLDVHALLQRIKKHPLINKYLAGGELVEWGAKTIPEGGLLAIPDRLSGDGLLIGGDAAGLVNVPALKGIHYAIQSGIYAADSIVEALKKQDTSEASLKSYDERIRGSYIFSDLHKVRHMRQAFKSGFYSGGIKAAIMTLSGGKFPSSGENKLSDAEEWKEVVAAGQEQFTAPAQSVSKVDGVYQAGNKTRDDIPTHLTAKRQITGDLADFYSAMCPAGVYEKNERGELTINAPNCVDCKATDILGPRWEPREGGSGPSYRQM